MIWNNKKAYTQYQTPCWTYKTIETKKAIEAKKQIQKHSKDFSGTLSDVECMKLIGIAGNTIYKYKAELKTE